MPTPLACFAVTAPGLEAPTAAELRQLQLLPTPTTGGVEFSGALTDVYRANLHLRTANRVLLRLGTFRATAFWELRKQASRLPWAEYLSPAQAVCVRATCHKSKLYHSSGVAERVVGAISDSLGQPVLTRPTLDEDDATAVAATAAPPQLIVVRLLHDQCTISLDTSGLLLHQRGYRLATAKAPLRETLAAGILHLAQWDEQAPLLDPFCGAGTVVIEAALRAAQRPPGQNRRFAFMDWPNFDLQAWGTLLAATPPRPAPALPQLFASDRDAGAIAATHANAARAEVSAYLDCAQRAVSAIEPPPTPGWVITNPPYGLRVSEHAALRNLYAQFGHTLRAKCPGWRVAFLCPDPALAHQTGLTFDPAHCPTLVNGGMRVTLWQSIVPKA